MENIFYVANGIPCRHLGSCISKSCEIRLLNQEEAHPQRKPRATVVASLTGLYNIRVKNMALFKPRSHIFQRRETFGKHLSSLHSEDMHWGDRAGGL